MRSRIDIFELEDHAFLVFYQPADTVLGFMAIKKWAALDRHLVTMEKPACVMSPHQKPQMKSLRVGRTSDHRLCVSSHRGAQPGLWIFSHGLRSAPAAA